MKTLFLQITIFCLFPLFCFASPGTITDHIHIDQFGYRSAAYKLAIISNPQTGYNATASFSPGSTYELRRWSDDVVVHSASITAWNSGATHAQSGDKVWWYDFSTYTTSGEFYVYDPTNNVGSNKFIIGDGVYNDVLKQAMRTFYYQRCGIAKTVTNGGNWNDAPCHVGSLQDTDCRSSASPNNASTSKDLSGGWHDAGDYNKYVNYAWSSVHDLLFAYQENSLIFGDDYNIPESGNGIPDIMDEIKWELDWMLKMQNWDGSTLMKISVSCWQAASPPSADSAQRMYGTAESSATRVVASLFAHASIVFASLGNANMNIYADTLKARAELAWTWLQANTSTSSYSNNGFCSSNPELDFNTQVEAMIGAAAFLYAATGNTVYRTYFDNNYTSIRPYSWTFWYAFQSTIQDIMLYYASLAGATTSVKNNIQNNCISSVNSNNSDFLMAWNNETDAYRAYMSDGNYVWGSNMWKANSALIFYNLVTHNLSPANASAYTNAAESFLHFAHGANPMNKVMLSNMYDYGGEDVCDEIYHAWFWDGTDYDNAQTSVYGPAPGFISGGINPNFSPDGSCSCTLEPPQNQPIQKAYKDWNTSFPENSWEITEPSISYQAAYVKLLSKFASSGGALPLELRSFSAILKDKEYVELNWEAIIANDFQHFEIEKSANGINFEKIGIRTPTPSHAADNYQLFDYTPFIGNNYYRLKMVDLDGTFEYSKIALVKVLSGVEFNIAPNPASTNFKIYLSSEQVLGEVEIEIFDATGSLIFSENPSISFNSLTKNISISDWDAGVYIIRIKMQGQEFVKKIVINK